MGATSEGRGRVWGRRLRRVVGGTIAVVLGLVAASALSNVGSGTAAAGDRLSPGERARLAESIHLRETLGDTVWPGWGAARIPQIAYNERFAFLVGYPGTPPDGWFREPGHEARGRAWETVPDDPVAGASYHRQGLAPGESPQAFTVRVGDVWVGSMPTLTWSRVGLARSVRSRLPPVVEWIPPYRLLGRLFFRGPRHHVSLMLHETFHAHQGRVAPERFARAERMVGRESEYPWDDPGARAAWTEEVGVLADALEAETVEDARALAGRFLEMRAERRRALAPALVEYERHREWLEGTAKYVELEIWRAADRTPWYEPLPEARRTGGLEDYRGSGDALAREVGQLRRSARQGETVFYYSGMAQAMLLDRVGAAWKRALIEDGRSLEALLSEALAPAAGVEEGG